MKYIVLCLISCLAGCASEPRVLASNSQSVMVKADTLKEALATADKECAKIGKTARIESDEAEPFGKILIRVTCQT